MTVDPKLTEATRCLVALRTAQDGLRLASLPCWSDGEALWLARADSDPVVEALRGAPTCAVLIGDLGAELTATGLARIFGAGDPLGLLAHGPVIALAMAAIAVRHPREVARAWLPRSQIRPPVAVRLALRELRNVEAPPPRPGIAPALPAVVPADIRRRLSGLRDVVVAGEGAAGLCVERATWSAGFVLAGDLPVSPGKAIAVAVEAGSGRGAIGVALSGELDARGALRPVRASWWNGSRTGTAPLSTPPRGAVTLPD
ncbi:MAG: hypothetical protein ACRDYX_06625 [Egibacteraceae bacterium]